MCPKKETSEYLQNNPYLLKITRKKFMQMIKLFASNSISGEDVLTYPNIFRYKYETVKMRIDDLKQNTDLKNIRLSMLVISRKHFQKRCQVFIEDTQAREEFHDKCGLLVKSLNCLPKHAASLVESSKWFNDSKLVTLRKKLDLYLSIEPEMASHIKMKIWLLSFPLDHIESKMKDLKRLEIPMFIWQKSLAQIMKLSGEKYDEFLQKLLKEKSIYDGCTSKKEFLCKRLKCSESEIQLMVYKYPKLLNVKILKLHSHLELLQNKFGFSNAEIIENALAFKFSRETLLLRFYELRNIGSTMPNLFAMTKDSRAYASYLDRLKESLL